MNDQKEVTIYTDGACSGNPGPGGWAAIILFNDKRKDICGGEENTTNNKMELKAVISGIKALKTPCRVNIYTDSTYVKNGITEWIKKWKINNWRTSKNLKVKNLELWMELDEVTTKHSINWYWIKSHAGHKYNEEADCLARKEIYNLQIT
ncbi:ribonuclease HI [Candidatus Mesenet endosymbiont of Phosphuga atrata]|uniref:ribonuclease HI n=1 Tax=Candidatus Mesenet endosymbiont of Phosphuga atrata TaxID=3066221 RepID=UPI0030D28219